MNSNTMLFMFFSCACMMAHANHLLFDHDRCPCHSTANLFIDLVLFPSRNLKVLRRPFLKFLWDSWVKRGRGVNATNTIFAITKQIIKLKWR